MTVPTVQVIETGDRNHIIHVIGETDTVGGTLVDVSTLVANSSGDAVTAVSLYRVQYETDATIKLDWDATADVTFFVAPPGTDTKCYKDIGGISNNAGAGKTGDVIIPTPAGVSNYTMTLWFRKKY